MRNTTRTTLPLCVFVVRSHPLNWRSFCPPPPLLRTHKLFMCMLHRLVCHLVRERSRGPTDYQARNTQILLSTPSVHSLHPVPPQVWSLDVNASCTRLVTAASDNQLRVWALDTQQGEGGGGGGDGAPAAMAVDGEEGREEESGGSGGGGGEDDVVAVYMGSVARQGNGEGSNIVVCSARRDA